MIDRQRWVGERRRRALEERPNGVRGGWIFRRKAVSTHTTGWQQRHWTSRLLHRLGDMAADSSAGVAAAIVVAVWGVVGLASGFATWWQTILYSVTCSVTFVMVFVIRHTQERQTSATQRKLDELIRASRGADDGLIAVEEADDEHLRALADLNLADRELAERRTADE
jgi:low affinity Fe/Cu permease